MTDTVNQINWNDETTRRFITSRVARPKPGDTRRRCFYVDDVEPDEHGIIPMLVIKGEPGYSSMVNEDDPRGTWYWGQTLEEAQRICDLVNSELFGLTRDEAIALVGANITASMDIPVTTFLGGTDGRTVVVELDGVAGGVERGSADLSPAQARALAADLEALADEAES